MLNFILSIIWLFLPAGLANASPALFRWLPVFNSPIDFGKSINGKRILGDNKTWRGLICGTFIAIFFVYIQKIIYPLTSEFSIINYSEINFLLFGFLLGFGALFGDIVESFFKRRKNLEPGESWVPFDQIDWILGGAILLNIYILLPIKTNLGILIIFGIIHPAVNHAAYWLGIRKTKF